jgi:hypothetical protein
VFSSPFSLLFCCSFFCFYKAHIALHW